MLWRPLQCILTKTSRAQAGTASAAAKLACVSDFDVRWQVRGVLLDPSCSGSGTAAGRLDALLPSRRRQTAAGEPDEVRHEYI